MVEIFDNIRKLYVFQPPCPELLPYVEFYSETSPEAMQHYIGEDRFTVKMFPSFTPTIWLNLGAPYLLKHGDSLQQVAKNGDVLVLRSGIVERRNLPTDNIFTVKFHPGGFEAVFGFPQTAIGHAVVNVNELIPDTLLTKLRKAADFDSRRRLLESFLLDQLTRQRELAYPLQCVQESIRAFSTSGMQLNNQQLAGRQYLTDKTFYRYFTQVIGASPKHFFATLRAREALTVYVRNKTGFEPADHGYYDLSHFYKDVLKFTGQTIRAANPTHSFV